MSSDTVRDLYADRTRDGNATAYVSANHLLAVLGIDPDTPVETLRRRLAWGEQVEQRGTQACGLEGEEFLLYRWRNALNQWKWWHERYAGATGDDRGRMQIEMDERRAVQDNPVSS